MQKIVITKAAWYLCKGSPYLRGTLNMITDIRNCNTKIGKGVVKCPKCAELFFENTLVEGPSAVNQVSGNSSSSSPIFTPFKPQSEFRSTAQEKNSGNSFSSSKDQDTTISLADAVSVIYSKLRSTILFWNVLMV